MHARPIHVVRALAIIVSLALWAEAGTADSIIPFTSMFEKLNGLAVWGSSTWTRDGSPRPHFGRYGMEVLLGPYDVGGKKSPLRAKIADGRDSMAVLEMRKQVGERGKLDSTSVQDIVTEYFRQQREARARTAG